MPNRVLREGILTSERVNALNWPEEVFYRRLMSVVDDYGRYYATPMLLRAACYPLHLNKVSDSDIEKWLTACVNAALVRVYPAKDGKRYLEMRDFKQQVRAKESKFPPAICKCSADATQMSSKCEACAHLDGDVVEGEDDSSSARKRTPQCPTLEIIDLYHTVAPRLRQMRIIADKTQAAIAARWRQDSRFQSLEFWKWFFEYCNENRFLSGQSEPRPGAAKPFHADLAWIVTASHFADILNEKYR